MIFQMPKLTFVKGNMENKQEQFTRERFGGGESSKRKLTKTYGTVLKTSLLISNFLK